MKKLIRLISELGQLKPVSGIASTTKFQKQLNAKLDEWVLNLKFGLNYHGGCQKHLLLILGSTLSWFYYVNVGHIMTISVRSSKI